MPTSAVRTAHVLCVHITVHNCITYSTEQLLIFPLILQTVVAAQTMSTGGEGENDTHWRQAVEKSPPMLVQYQIQSAVASRFP